MTQGVGRKGRFVANPPDPRIENIAVSAFTVPTDGPDGIEADGTLSWDSTTLVLVQATAASRIGLGYTYGDASVGSLIRSKLAPVVQGQGALSPSRVWEKMHAALRNAGQPGPGMMALSAVDVALWDLKARLLDQPLVQILPAFHDAVPVYGSGGFTNYPNGRLAEQLSDWIAAGIPRVKLKISRNPDADPERLRVARNAVGPATELFTDANGALARKDALYWSRRLAEEWDVRWFEEPVSSGDIEGLRMIRERAPGHIQIAAGEYGYTLDDFTALLDGPAVDCLQADVTRCGGITGLLQVAGTAAAQHMDLSGHCAPAISAHALCAVRRLRHLEYFHDHVRIEQMLFDGFLSPVGGCLHPDLNRPGMGLTLNRASAEKFQVDC